jgi:hypothetical protein
MMPISVAAELSLAGAAAFSLLLILLHFLKPENDPSWRMISEYQIGRYGWLMQLAFFCWSIGVFALAAVLSQHIFAIADIFLFVIAASIFGAGIFVTNPITTPNELQNRASKLHTLFGAITIIGTPFVVTAIDWSLGGSPLVASIQPYLILLTLIVWLGFLMFVLAMVYYGSKKIPLGPHAKIGWPNRFMVFTYIVWLVVIACVLTAAKVPNGGSDQYAAAILACYSQSPTAAEDMPIPNNSVQYVKETSRMFINMPKDLYPQDLQSSWTTVGGNATAGSVNEPGFGEAEGALPQCWSSYVDFEGSGEVDLRVKSIVNGAPDYFLRFIVSSA